MLSSQSSQSFPVSPLCNLCPVSPVSLFCPLSPLSPPFPGGLKAQSPSGGDSLAVGEQITMTERLRLAGGFTRLLQGTEADETAGRQGVGVALTTDWGYIFVPNNMGGDNVVFTDYCRDNDILLVHPFKEGGAPSTTTPSLTHLCLTSTRRMRWVKYLWRDSVILIYRCSVRTVVASAPTSGRLWSSAMLPSSSTRCVIFSSRPNT